MSPTACPSAGRPPSVARMDETALTVHQTARPQGFPTREHFSFVESAPPRPAVGSALVRNLYWSVDPYHRELMDGGFALGAPLEGRTLGRVVDSRTPELPEGTVVFHRKGWRTHAVVAPAEVRLLPELAGVPLSAHLSVLGGTGLTAYAALTRIARLREGEDVFVTSAAGGVGTAAGRFARLLGARRVVGSTGSAAKADWLVRQGGYHAAFDYHAGDVRELLAEAAPDGVDLALDNVGGGQLAAAVDALRDFGRVVRIGTVGQYNIPGSTEARFDWSAVVERSLRIEGFLVRHHLDLQAELYDFAAPHLRSGRLVADETVTDGFENIVDAFIGMLHGRNTGKALVRDVTAR